MRLTEKVPVPDNWQTLRYHRLSALSGFGVGIDLDALVAHMRANGYDDDEPIILYDGEILDGRHKHTAAIKAEVVPTFRLYIGADPVAFVTKKILRQHFNESQRALFAAALAKLPRGANQHTSIDVCSPPSKAKAAEMLNVSESSVDRAKKILDHGTPKLQEAVADGTLSLSDAATVATEPAKVQNRAVKEVQSGKAPTVTAAVFEYQYDPNLCRQCNRLKRTQQPLPRNCPDCKALTQSQAVEVKPEPVPTPSNPRSAEVILANCIDKGEEGCYLNRGQAQWLINELARLRTRKERPTNGFQKPTVEEVKAYCRERGNSVDAQTFVDFYESKGWLVGRVPMKDWRAAVRTWERNNYGMGSKKVDPYAGLKDFIARGDDEPN